MENYIPEIGDVVESNGNMRVVLGITNTTEQGIDELIPTTEYILVVAPCYHMTESRIGYVVNKTRWSGDKPIIVEFYNKEYIFEHEVTKEIGYIHDQNVIKKLISTISNDQIDCKNHFDLQKALAVCHSAYIKTDFQKQLTEAAPPVEIIHQ